MSLDVATPQARPTREAIAKVDSVMDDTSSYDLICVGFGTTSLALSVALAESNIGSHILFLENSTFFDWKPSKLHPDKFVGASFLRDLITTQNPRSRFTFINFLHSTGRLVQFANLSRLAPSRRLVKAYFKWVADQIEAMGWVKYGHETLTVQPVKSANSDRIDRWVVNVRNDMTGVRSRIHSSKVVLSTNLVAQIPIPLNTAELKDLVVHSSTCVDLLETVCSQHRAADIAIVGADQEAAEIFEHLHAAETQHRACMFIEDSALRPEDDTAFSRNLLDAVHPDIATFPPELRRCKINGAASSMVKVAQATIESIYELQYAQGVLQPNQSDWKRRLYTSSEIVGAQREQNKIRLIIRNRITGLVTSSERTFDLVISASGLRPASAIDYITSHKQLLDGDSLTVDRYYRVNFRRGVLASNCGLWVLDSLKDYGSRSDDFSLLAEKAQCAAKSICSLPMERDQDPGNRTMNIAML